MPVPDFNYTVEHIEALRRAARAHSSLMRISPNRQTLNINAVLSKNQNLYKADEISPSRWRAFIEDGSKTFPEKRGILHAAWDWIASEKIDFLSAELGISDAQGNFDPASPYEHLAMELIDPIPRSVDLNTNSSEYYRVIYDVPDRPGYVAAGLLIFDASNNIPTFGFMIVNLHSKNSKAHAFSGTGFYHRHGLMLIGCSTEACLCTLYIRYTIASRRKMRGTNGKVTINELNGNQIIFDIELIGGSDIQPAGVFKRKDI